MIKACSSAVRGRFGEHQSRPRVPEPHITGGAEFQINHLSIEKSGWAPAPGGMLLCSVYINR